ncbi:helix-turn-helix domain-containing protein [Siminovitchia sediminis]|uniref:Helix-turn-helix domain-containing protein n=1 Tax=Siminovitchia sediminis TaxID=1274353 RepID=A0ABW4KLN0_9BACI
MSGLHGAIKEHYERQKPKYVPIERKALDTREVAELLGVSKFLIYRLVREKQIPFVRIGTRLIYRKNSIEKWLNELEYTP